METVIVICLLIVIVLLLQDKIIIQSPKKIKNEKVNPDLPDIMGQPKQISRYSESSTENEISQEINPANLDIEYDEHEDTGIQVPLEEPDEVFSYSVDFEDEVWNEIPYEGFAQGVTFEELTSVGLLLQKENLEMVQKEAAVAIVQKIQGTELFSLLENSIEGASKKIARLFDSSLSLQSEVGSSELRKSDFDIENFV